MCSGAVRWWQCRIVSTLQLSTSFLEAQQYLELKPCPLSGMTWMMCARICVARQQCDDALQMAAAESVCGLQLLVEWLTMLQGDPWTWAESCSSPFSNCAEMAALSLSQKLLCKDFLLEVCLEVANKGCCYRCEQ